MEGLNDSRAELVRLARQQHGVVARRQLRDLLIGRGQIDHWIRMGQLHRVFRGTFVVGRPIDTDPAMWMAANLRCGSSAALAGRSAAAAWGFMETSNGLLVVRGKGRCHRERGSGQHRHLYLEVQSGSLIDTDVSRIGRIRLMTPARTLIHLAGELGKHDLRQAFVGAGYRRLLTPGCLGEIVTRGRHFKGHARLMELVEQWHPGTGKLRSPMEAEFLMLCGEYGIPAPRTNFRIGGYEADCYWPGTRVAVELDSRTFHDHGFGFEDDRDKGNDLSLAGYVVLRFTHRMITRNPEKVARILREHLERAGSRVE